VDPETKIEKIIYLMDVLKREDDEEKKTFVYENLNVLVQSKYENLLSKCLMHGIEKLHKITGIRPEFDVDYVQQTYNKLLTVRIRGYAERFKKLYEITGVRPEVNEELIQSAYEESLEKRKIFDFEAIWDSTEIKPKKNLLNAYKELKEEVIKGSSSVSSPA
jgi:hypothetical protein